MAGPEGLHEVAIDHAGSGERFRLPSVGTSPRGSFLRFGVNADMYFDLPVKGLGADLDLGRVDLRLVDFEVGEASIGGSHPVPRAGG